MTSNVSTVEPSGSTYSYSRWEEAWHVNHTGWHLSNVHRNLEQFCHELTAGHASKSLRIFVPLCGKSFDMLWLAEQGHEVVGVEFVQKPIECLFTENDFSFTTEVAITSDGSKAPLYRCTKEGINIAVLQCSIFSATEEALGGKFHAVWDRGSLVAIDPADQIKYVALLKSFLHPAGRLLLDSFRYDQSKIDGPPFCVSEEHLQSLFQQSFHIRQLGMEEFEELEIKQTGRPKFPHKRLCHLLTLK